MPHNSRTTIGFFINTMTVVTDYEVNLLLGVEEAAKAHDANLLVITGDQLESSGSGWAKPQNLVYGLVGKDCLDGIVIGSSAIGSLLKPEEMDRFVSSFAPLPVSLIGPPRPGFPCSTADNKAGIKELVRHLAAEHGRRSFAFVRGLAGTDGDLRFQAFREALAELGLPFRPELVFQGDWSRDSGQAAARAFLGSGLPFDALMAANDHMAFGAAGELMARGKWVPKDVAVTGFDDTAEAEAFNPPLTTVKQPIRELARVAAESLFSRLEGKGGGQLSVVPTETVIRRSCGCLLESLKAKEAADLRGREGAKATLFEEGMRRVLSGPPERAEPDFLGQVEMETVVAQEKGEDLDTIRLAIKSVPSRLGDLSPELRAVAERAVTVAELIVREIQNRALRSGQVESERRERGLRRLMQAMSATFEPGRLQEVLDRDLPDVGIPGYLVSRWEGEGTPPARLKPLMASLSAGKRIAVGEDEPAYPSRELYPLSLRPAARWTAIASPLCFGRESIGLAVLEWGVQKGSPYEAVFRQLESSLEGSGLLASAQAAERDQEERNLRVGSLVRPMIESIDRTAAVAGERLEGTRVIAEQTAESAKRIARTDELLAQIGRSVAQVMEIIKIIDDISETVNLISLNASIEAAHAGQYGKGFAVLAKEIKKMAASTQQRSGDIAVQLSGLASLIGDAGKAARESLESFQAQDASVKTLTASLSEIASVMADLNGKSKGILDVMGT